MSHYPTTAELAAFRRDAARVTFGTLDPNEYDPSTLAYRVLDSVTRSLYPGAWPDERRDGIGLGPEPWDGAEDRWGSNVRSEASALRSRAYRAIADSAWAYDPDWEDFGRYRETFCPEHTARMMRQIRIVARAVGVL